ncbi:MAG TPA: 4'-phosphopantetheinyl transferase superfamily protein [Gemmatimonadales bacterium]|jgi:4'-phosphopantetheinyl transferase
MQAREVHSWAISLEAPAETREALFATLSADERSRSARFRQERDRRRFIVARGALRRLLGDYLALPSREIRFVYNEYGKPALSAELESPLRFNLSHAADLALVAIADGADVGVDVEHVSADSDYLAIARDVLSDAEGDYLRTMPSHLRGEAFLRSWTMQEAYVKARGDGLSMPLARFTGAWSLYHLQPAPGYVGALAIAGGGWRLCQSSWNMRAPSTA